MTSQEPKPAVAVDDMGSMVQGVHTQRFSALGLLGLAFAILNSWVAMAASLSLVLPSGGPVAMLWGLCISCLGVMAMAASLAEICAVVPSPGGPYHWVFALAPARGRLALSYIQGWAQAAGWVTLTATASSLGAGFIINIISLLHPDFAEQPYQIFLLYVAYALLGWVINVFAVKTLDGVNRFALFWSLVGAVTVCIVCLATASPTYRTGKEVFGTFSNTTGWDNFTAFMLGLLQSTFGLVGVDAVTHMVSEMPRSHVNAPRTMLVAPAIGAFSSWIVLMVLLFCLTDYDDVISATSGPLLTIIYQATGNAGGSVALLMFPVVSMATAATGILTAASRIVQSLAADRGLPFSNFFASENKSLQVPIGSITLTSVFVIIFGLIYLGSSVALNAILSSSVVLLQLSYAFPIVLLLCRGRGHLDTVAFHVGPRHFNLGAFGYVVNLFAVFFALFTSIFFLFPADYPVTGGSAMNWCVLVVFGVVPFLGGLSWIFHGRKHYQGPVNLDLALEVARRGLTEKDYERGMSAKEGMSLTNGGKTSQENHTAAPTATTTEAQTEATMESPGTQTEKAQ